MIYSNLPNGAITEIAKIANLSNATTGKALSGKKVRESSKIKALQALEKYLKQKKELEEQAKESIKQLLTQ